MTSPKTPSPDRLSEIRERAEKATDGFMAFPGGAEAEWSDFYEGSVYRDFEFMLARLAEKDEQLREVENREARTVLLLKKDLEAAERERDEALEKARHWLGQTLTPAGMDQLRAAERRAEDAEKLLREIEENETMCPICRQMSVYGHLGQCRLAQATGKKEPPNGVTPRINK